MAIWNRLRPFLAGEGEDYMKWRSVAVTTAALLVPPVVGVTAFGDAGGVAFVAALASHMTTKDAGVKIGVSITLAMAFAGFLSLGQPGVALVVAPLLGLMVAICGSWGYAKAAIHVLLPWTVFTSPLIPPDRPVETLLIFLGAMIWSVGLTWLTSEEGASEPEDAESDEYAAVFGAMLGVGLLVSVFVGGRFFGDHGFWFPLTFVILCLPPHGELFSRTIKRTLGTFIGTALALGVAMVSTAPVVTAAIGLIALPLAFRVLPRNYMLFTALLTLSVLEVLALVSDMSNLAWERVGTMLAAAALTACLGVAAYAVLSRFRPQALRALQDAPPDVQSPPILRH